MRMLQYELRLQKYIIASGDVRAYDDWDDWTLPPLKMEILKSDCADIAELVCENVFKGAEGIALQDFHKCYVKVLHGDNSVWHLIRANITSCCILLEYYSKKFAQTACLTLEDPGLLDVRFNAPRSNGKPDGVYRVRLSGKGDDVRAFVVEHIDGIRREFDFIHYKKDVYGYFNRVIVTEYADF